MKRIAISQRVVVDPRHGERRDCLDQRWSRLFDPLDVVLLAVPNSLGDVGAWVAALAIEGLVLSGGNSLAHLPGCLDTAPERDRTESQLLQWAAEGRHPVLGVCRGMQMMNHYLGGGIVPIEGHAGTRHALHLHSPDGPGRVVNSYHDWAIPSEALGKGMRPYAWDEAGHVEAMRHDALPWAAVMWHPERDDPSQDLGLITELFGVEEKRG